MVFMKSSAWHNFWHRPAGGHEVLTLALPLVISMSSWTLMHFIDRLFLTWHSKTSLAAALPAGMLSFAVESFFLGIAMYVNTFVAQYYGADRPERIGLAMWQGVWLALISAPLMLLMIPVAPAVFRAIGHDAAMQAEEVIRGGDLFSGAGLWRRSNGHCGRDFVVLHGSRESPDRDDRRHDRGGGEHRPRLCLDLRQMGVSGVGNRRRRLGNGRGALV
jgi:hypothetical protein